MDETVRWAIGTVVTGALALFGYHKAVDSMIKSGDDKLHQRINEVRHEYVRRDDLKEFKDDVRGALDRIEKKLDKS